MLKILVVTKNHPIEIGTVSATLHQAVGFGDHEVMVNSPQFIADMVAKNLNVSYLQTYYPALRAYKNVEKYMEESNLDILVTVGTIDINDALGYDAIVGLKNDEISDYTSFDEDFNTTEITPIKLENVDILFEKMDELIHFIRLTIKNYRREKRQSGLQRITTESNK